MVEMEEAAGLVKTRFQISQSLLFFTMSLSHGVHLNVPRIGVD